MNKKKINICMGITVFYGKFVFLLTKNKIYMKTINQIESSNLINFLTSVIKYPIRECIAFTQNMKGYC